MLSAGDHKINQKTGKVDWSKVAVQPVQPISRRSKKPYDRPANESKGAKLNVSAVKQLSIMKNRIKSKEKKNLQVHFQVEAELMEKSDKPKQRKDADIENQLAGNMEQLCKDGFREHQN